MATYKGKYTAAVFEPVDITLISVTYQNDAIGQPIAIEQTSTIPGRIGSVSATEDERAGQRGFKAEKEAVRWSIDYHECYGQCHYWYYYCFGGCIG